MEKVVKKKERTMSERNNELKDMIQKGQIDRAIEMVRSAKDWYESEKFVITVLGEKEPIPELVEAVLEAFFETRENSLRGHHDWMRSLRRFTHILWKREMYDWIKKFYKAVFEGPIKAYNSPSAEKFVYDFLKNAKFYHNPAEFGLTFENLHRWMNWRYHKNVKLRIKAGPFESEEAFLRWKLRHPEVCTAYKGEVGIYLVNVEEIRSTIQRLQELGVDTSEFNGLERDLLIKQLSELEAKLQNTIAPGPRKQQKAEIYYTRRMLSELLTSYR